jgi:hypothetical protein
MVFYIALLLAVLGLLGALGVVAALSGTIAFWLAFAGYALLALGNAMKGF